MTRENETKAGKRWWPELFYIFVTAVISDPITGKILFTRSKDREEWIPGAGGELIVPAKTNQPIYLQDTAIRETAEELSAQLDAEGQQVGLAIKIKGTVPFYLELQCGDLSLYGKDPATGEPIQTLFAYFLAELANQADMSNIVGKKQPGEEDCETVEIVWIPVLDFLREVELGKRKTFPSVIRALESINIRTSGNPFVKIWDDP